jgi:hypothetical protein
LVDAWPPQNGVAVHPNLQSVVGNVSVIYISRNKLIHTHRTSQPLFAATEEVQALIALSAYIPTDEERLGALACVEKCQFCRDKDGGECSPWIGMVPGVNGETGVEQFYNNSSLTDRGLISLVTGRIGATIGNAARGARSELLTSRSLTSIPSFDGQLLPFQTTAKSDLWKAEVIQCMKAPRVDN